MDTARYSLVQSRPKNIFKPTVLKPLPPLFPLPPAAVSRECAGKMCGNSSTPVPARPRRFSATPGPLFVIIAPSAIPVPGRRASIPRAAAEGELPARRRRDIAAGGTAASSPLPRLSCDSPATLLRRLPLCRASGRLHLRFAPTVPSPLPAALPLRSASCRLALPPFRFALPPNCCRFACRAPAAASAVFVFACRAPAAASAVFVFALPRSRRRSCRLRLRFASCRFLPLRSASCRTAALPLPLRRFASPLRFAPHCRRRGPPAALIAQFPRAGLPAELPPDDAEKTQ